MPRAPKRENNYRSSLTFGLEATFFAAIKMSTFQRIRHSSLARLFGDRLSQVHLFGPGDLGTSFKVISEYPYEPLEDNVVDYRCWNIMTCETAAPSHPEWFSGYESQPVEVISPPYFVHSSQWEIDIQRVFSSRPGQFNPIPAREFRLYHELNGSTGFHVHIGNGVAPTSGFSFNTIRNLAMILLVYEPLIDKLLDGQFYAPPFSQPPRPISPTTNQHFIPPNLPAHAPRTILALHLYNTCHDTQSVVNAISPYFEDDDDTIPRRYYKFNFNPLLDSVDAPLPSDGDSDGETDHPQPTTKRKQPTFEFRHNPGTLDPDTMIHWIRFLGALVDFAGKLSSQATIEFLGLEDMSITYHAAPENGEPKALSTYALPTSDSPPSLSAFSLLSGLQPAGSFARLVTAMEIAHIPLDYGTTRYWRRKVSSTLQARVNANLEKQQEDAERQKDSLAKKAKDSTLANKETENSTSAGKETEDSTLASKETENSTSAGKETEDSTLAGKEN